MNQVTKPGPKRKRQTMPITLSRGGCRTFARLLVAQKRGDYGDKPAWREAPAISASDWPKR